MEIDEKLVGNLAERHGIETIMGKPGGVAFIHCNLVHGSSPNISPWPRAILYINYNSVENIPLEETIGPGSITTQTGRH